MFLPARRFRDPPCCPRLPPPVPNVPTTKPLGVLWGTGSRWGWGAPVFPSRAFPPPPSISGRVWWENSQPPCYSLVSGSPPTPSEVHPLPPAGGRGGVLGRHARASWRGVARWGGGVTGPPTASGGGCPSSPPPESPETPTNVPPPPRDVRPPPPPPPPPPLCPPKAPPFRSPPHFISRTPRVWPPPGGGQAVVGGPPPAPPSRPC